MSQGLKDRHLVELAKQSNHQFSQRVVREALQHLEELDILDLISRKPLQHLLKDSFLLG